MAHKKRYCTRGHDTEKFGRQKANNHCKECDRLRKKGKLPPRDADIRLPTAPLEKIYERRCISITSLGPSAARRF